MHIPMPKGTTTYLHTGKHSPRRKVQLHGFRHASTKIGHKSGRQASWAKKNLPFKIQPFHRFLLEASRRQTLPLRTILFTISPFSGKSLRVGKSGKEGSRPYLPFRSCTDSYPLPATFKGAETGILCIVNEASAKSFLMRCTALVAHTKNADRFKHIGCQPLNGFTIYNTVSCFFTSAGAACFPPGHTCA